MKAIKIDVVKKEVYEVNIEDTLEAIYEQIESDMFEVALAIRPQGDVVYVDEEGLLKVSKGWFTIQGQPQPLSGHGLVVGLDHHNGASRDVKVTVDEVRKIVTFMPFK